MSWYGARSDALSMGHSVFPAHVGEGGTYYDKQNAECMKLAADYQVKFLNAWREQLYAIGGGK